jgi:chromatin remodeling complex protein RSC6
MDTGKPHPDAVKELWAYVHWMVGCERRAIERQQKARQIRQHCLWVLKSENFSDEEAIKQVV